MATAQQQQPITPAAALARLREGNRRHLSGQSVPHGMTNQDRRAALAREQRPFCVLVGCSDSRVPPELLFNCGLGELFIVRNAGNVVDLAAMGSIEYGAVVLGAPLVVVLGHRRCGAVQAAVEVVERDASLPGSIGRMIEPIVPAVLQAKRMGGSDLLDAAVRQNVLRTVGRLRDTERLLVEPQREGRLRIVGAHYDLDHGSVEFLD